MQGYICIIYMWLESMIYIAGPLSISLSIYASMKHICGVAPSYSFWVWRSSVYKYYFICWFILFYFIWKQCILTFFTMYRGWWKHRWSGQFWGDFHEAISKPNNPFISHWTVSFIIFFWSWWTKAGNIYLNV